MGSELVLMFIPLGALLFVVIAYGAARGPDRIYPVVALVASVLAAGYIASQARSGYLVWFLIWFALVAFPIGAAAHVTRWLVHRSHAAKAEKNAT